MRASKNTHHLLAAFLGSLIISLASNQALSQTEPMYSQYMGNMLAVNPAYAGSREVNSLNVLHRKQWIGIPGSPQTTSVSFDGSVLNNSLGLGVLLYDDRLGVEKADGANLAISTRIKISSTGILSGGLLIGLMNYRADLNLVSNRFTNTDPAFYSNFNKWLPSFGAGVFYNTDHFYAGVSMPNLLRSRLTALDLIKSGIQQINDYHIFLTTGFVLDLNEDVKIKPSTMLKMVSGAPIQFDLNTNVWLKDVIGFGFSYRTADAVVGMIELQANRNLRIGYAYDYPISILQGYTQGTHELMIRYEFSAERSNIKSTRYF